MDASPSPLPQLGGHRTQPPPQRTTSQLHFPHSPEKTTPTSSTRRQDRLHIDVGYDDDGVPNAHSSSPPPPQLRSTSSEKLWKQQIRNEVTQPSIREEITVEEDDDIGFSSSYRFSGTQVPLVTLPSSPVSPASSIATDTPRSILRQPGSTRQHTRKRRISFLSAAPNWAHVPQSASEPGNSSTPYQNHHGEDYEDFAEPSLRYDANVPPARHTFTPAWEATREFSAERLNEVDHGHQRRASEPVRQPSPAPTASAPPPQDEDEVTQTSESVRRRAKHRELDNQPRERSAARTWELVDDEEQDAHTQPHNYSRRQAHANQRRSNRWPSEAYAEDPPTETCYTPSPRAHRVHVEPVEEGSAVEQVDDSDATSTEDYVSPKKSCSRSSHSPPPARRERSPSLRQPSPNRQTTQNRSPIPIQGVSRAPEGPFDSSLNMSTEESLSRASSTVRQYISSSERRSSSSIIEHGRSSSESSNQRTPSSITGSSSGSSIRGSDEPPVSLNMALHTKAPKRKVTSKEQTKRTSDTKPGMAVRHPSQKNRRSRSAKERHGAAPQVYVDPLLMERQHRRRSPRHIDPIFLAQSAVPPRRSSSQNSRRSLRESSSDADIISDYLQRHDFLDDKQVRSAVPHSKQLHHAVPSLSKVIDVPAAGKGQKKSPSERSVSTAASSGGVLEEKLVWNNDSRANSHSSSASKMEVKQRPSPSETAAKGEKKRKRSLELTRSEDAREGRKVFRKKLVVLIRRKLHGTDPSEDDSVVQMSLLPYEKGKESVLKPVYHRSNSRNHSLSARKPGRLRRHNRIEENSSNSSNESGQLTPPLEKLIDHVDQRTQSHHSSASVNNTCRRCFRRAISVLSSQNASRASSMAPAGALRSHSGSGRNNSPPHKGDFSIATSGEDSIPQLRSQTRSIDRGSNAVGTQGRNRSPPYREPPAPVPHSITSPRRFRVEKPQLRRTPVGSQQRGTHSAEAMEPAAYLNDQNDDFYEALQANPVLIQPEPLGVTAIPLTMLPKILLRTEQNHNHPRSNTHTDWVATASDINDFVSLGNESGQRTNDQMQPPLIAMNSGMPTFVAAPVLQPYSPQPGEGAVRMLKQPLRPALGQQSDSDGIPAATTRQAVALIPSGNNLDFSALGKGLRPTVNGHPQPTAAALDALQAAFDPCSSDMHHKAVENNSFAAVPLPSRSQNTAANSVPLYVPPLTVDNISHLSQEWQSTLRERTSKSKREAMEQFLIASAEAGAAVTINATAKENEPSPFTGNQHGLKAEYFGSISQPLQSRIEAPHSFWELERAASRSLPSQHLELVDDSEPAATSQQVVAIEPNRANATLPSSSATSAAHERQKHNKGDSKLRQKRSKINDSGAVAPSVTFVSPTTEPQNSPEIAVLPPPRSPSSLSRSALVGHPPHTLQSHSKDGEGDGIAVVPAIRRASTASFPKFSIVDVDLAMSTGAPQQQEDHQQRGHSHRSPSTPQREKKKERSPRGKKHSHSRGESSKRRHHSHRRHSSHKKREKPLPHQDAEDDVATSLEYQLALLQAQHSGRQLDTDERSRRKKRKEKHEKREKHEKHKKKKESRKREKETKVPLETHDEGRKETQSSGEDPSGGWNVPTEDQRPSSYWQSPSSSRPMRHEVNYPSVRYESGIDPSSSGRPYWRSTELYSGVSDSVSRRYMSTANDLYRPTASRQTFDEPFLGRSTKHSIPLNSSRPSFRASDRPSTRWEDYVGTDRQSFRDRTSTERSFVERHQRTSYVPFFSSNAQTKPARDNEEDDFSDVRRRSYFNGVAPSTYSETFKPSLHRSSSATQERISTHKTDDVLVSTPPQEAKIDESLSKPYGNVFNVPSSHHRRRPPPPPLPSPRVSSVLSTGHPIKECVIDDERVLHQFAQGVHHVVDSIKRQVFVYS